MDKRETRYFCNMGFMLENILIEFNVNKES